MSRMQEALSRKDYDCARLAVPVAEPCEADIPERSGNRYHDKTLGESDTRQRQRSLIVWMVRNPPTRGNHPDAESISRLKSPGVERTSAPGAWKRSEGRLVSGEPLQKESESVAAQVKRFQERADLRECLLPGMLSRISRKACEGWQRHASVRTSRVVAKMKRESCKKCQYSLEPHPASA
jgi:hypothetical protein